jgi:hypothetical protein
MIIQNINNINDQEIENVRLEVKDKIEGNKIGFSFRIGRGQRRFDRADQAVSNK